LHQHQKSTKNKAYTKAPRRTTMQHAAVQIVDVAL